MHGKLCKSRRKGRSNNIRVTMTMRTMMTIIMTMRRMMLMTMMMKTMMMMMATW